ncbi:MAG TPA: hypothetical protein VHW01_03040 [Polyangiaceae bacterium]|jgi:hypothetical protein|nr:hypothetical protein [Polyangiaceae bacterium]
MRRSTTKYLLSAGLLTFGSFILTPSCTKNDSSMFVVGAIDIGATTCLAKADTTDAMLAGGTLDTAFTHSYTAFLLVGNQLTQQGSREDLRTETSRITLRGAEVTLTDVGGAEIAGGHYSTVSTGFVDASVGDAPSYGAVAVNVIPNGLLARIQVPPVVLAKIRVFGNTLGGTSITSSELDFPITICEGCLVTYPAEDDDPAQPMNSAYLCATTASTTTTTTEAPPCIFGQDQPFPCTACSASLKLCLDPTQNPSYAPATP